MANPYIGGEERMKRIEMNKGKKVDTRQGEGKSKPKVMVNKKPMAKVKKK